MRKFVEIKNNKAIKELEELMKDKSVQAGYFDSDVYDDGQGVPDIAFYNEATRTFMSLASQDAEKDVVALCRDLMKKNYNADKAFKTIGLYLVGKIKMRIKTSKSWAEGNKDSTVRQKTRGGKAGDHPLIDTGFMMKSTDFKVIK